MGRLSSGGTSYSSTHHNGTIPAAKQHMGSYSAVDTCRGITLAQLQRSGARGEIPIRILITAQQHLRFTAASDRTAQEKLEPLPLLYGY
jgi:hypothetical protein